MSTISDNNESVPAPESDTQILRPGPDPSFNLSARTTRNFSAVKTWAMIIFVILPHALSVTPVLIFGNSIGEVLNVMFNTSNEITAFSVIMIIGFVVLSIRCGLDAINNTNHKRSFIPPLASIALVALSVAQFLLLSEVI
jgi:hypothetical protein